MMEPRFIIVIGASAGGLQAVTELMAQLTETNAAVFVVMHINNMADINPLVQRIQKNSAFRCKAAEHNEDIRTGVLYMAVPNQHMLLKDGKVILGRGALENRYRPSIDVLFRSAAVAYAARTIAII